MEILNETISLVVAPSKGHTFTDKSIENFVSSLNIKYINRISIKVDGDWITVNIRPIKGETLQEIEERIILSNVKWIQEIEKQDNYYYYDNWNRGLHEFTSEEDAIEAAKNECGSYITIYKSNSGYKKEVKAGGYTYP